MLGNQGFPAIVASTVTSANARPRRLRGREE
jgi:hypothetical protein